METTFDLPTISQVLDDVVEVTPIGQVPVKEVGNEYERHMLLALHRLARYHHLRGLVGQSKISPQDFAALSEEKVMAIQQQGVARRGILQRLHAVIQEPTLSHRMEELLFVRSSENLESFTQQADALERFLTEHADVAQQLRGQQMSPEHCLQMAAEANHQPAPPAPGALSADTSAETKAGEDPRASPAATPQDVGTAAPGPAVVSSCDDNKDGDAASSLSPPVLADAAATVTDTPPEGTVAVPTNGVDDDAVEATAATSTSSEPMSDATVDSSAAGAVSEVSSSTMPNTNGEITNPEEDSAAAGASTTVSSSSSAAATSGGEKSEPTSKTTESNAMNDVHPTPTKAPADDDAVASISVPAEGGEGDSAAAAAKSAAEENSAATADGFLS